MRGFARGDEHAVARKSRDRRLKSLDKKPQPFGERHDPLRSLGGCDQNAVAAVRKVEACAATRHQHARRRAETAQAFEPNRARRRQLPCELHDLPPACIGRTEGLSRQFRHIGCAEQTGADRVGPQHLCSVGRPQPRSKRARCVYREPWIADPLQLELSCVHGGDWIGSSGFDAGFEERAGRTMTALTEG